MKLPPCRLYLLLVQLELPRQLTEIKLRLPYRTKFLCYDKTRGANVSVKLTIDFLDTQVQKQKNSVTCTTGNLIKLNDRINDSLNDIYLMTNEVTFSELFSYLYQCFQSLIHLTE